ALALVVECRTRRALARAERGWHAAQRDDPGEDDQPLRTGELLVELGEPERIGGGAGERPDPVHATQHRLQGVGERGGAAAGQPVDREAWWRVGLRARGGGGGLEQPQRCGEGAAGELTL